MKKEGAAAIAAARWTTATTAACVLIKMLQAIQIRFGPVYASFLADYLRVDAGDFLDAIGAAALCTAATIVLAPLQDVYGAHRIFVFGETMAVLGLALALCHFSLPLISIGWFLFLGGASLINGAFQSLLSAAVAPAELGRITAVLEGGWSFASLIGLPLVGVVLQRTSWSVLFGALIALHVPAAVFLAAKFNATAAAVAANRQAANESTASSSSPSALAAISSSLSHFRTVLGNARAVAVLVFAVCVTANSTLNGAVLGQWLRRAFDCDSETVGLLSLCLGAGELVGTVAVVRVGDRIGHRRAIWLGCACVIAAQCALAAATSGIDGLAGRNVGLVMFFVCAACTEFTLICAVTFVSSGAASGARDSIGTLMCLFFCCFNIGAMGGAFIVTPAFERAGVAGVSLTGASLVVVGVCTLRAVMQCFPVASDEDEVGGDTEGAGNATLENGLSKQGSETVAAPRALSRDQVLEQPAPALDSLPAAASRSDAHASLPAALYLIMGADGAVRVDSPADLRHSVNAAGATRALEAQRLG